MILARDTHPSAAACFEELNAAVEALTFRAVAFNAHNAHCVSANAIIYNLESIPDQVDPTRWAGRTVWDSIDSNIPRYPESVNVTHVPVGYHPSMERFQRAEVLDIDVVFTGALNARREKILNGIAKRGYRVEYVGPTPGNHGAKRDAILARARLALNILFHPSAPYPQPRMAHLIANKVPVLSEWCADGWDFVGGCDYGFLVDQASRFLDGSYRRFLDESYRDGTDAGKCYQAFRSNPMRLPQ